MYASSLIAKNDEIKRFAGIDIYRYDTHCLLPVSWTDANGRGISWVYDDRCYDIRPGYDETIRYRYVDIGSMSRRYFLDIFSGDLYIFDNLRENDEDSDKGPSETCKIDIKDYVTDDTECVFISVAYDYSQDRYMIIVQGLVMKGDQCQWISIIDVKDMLVYQWRDINKNIKHNFIRYTRPYIVDYGDQGYIIYYRGDYSYSAYLAKDKARVDNIEKNVVYIKDVKDIGIHHREKME